VDRLARRLRAARRRCRTVVLRLRFNDFSRASRSHTLAHATAQTNTILTAARALLAAAAPMIESGGLTLVGVALANLEDDTSTQLVFPVDRQHALDATLDELRDRFGAAAITRAVLLGQDPGITVPLLPD
jgi:DNA polymerase IV